MSRNENPPCICLRYARGCFFIFGGKLSDKLLSPYIGTNRTLSKTNTEIVVITIENVSPMTI